jgi:hypothetical protein
MRDGHGDIEQMSVDMTVLDLWRIASRSFTFRVTRIMKREIMHYGQIKSECSCLCRLSST